MVLIALLRNSSIFNFKMQVFVKKLFLFATIVLLVACSIDYVFTAVFQNGKTNKTQWLYSLKNKKYDIAILGNSRSWWNINVSKMNKDLQSKCISLSNNHLSFSEMLLRLKQFYNNGNKLEELLLQTEYWSFFNSSPAFSNTVYNNIPFLDDTLTYNFLSDRSNEWVKLKYVPLWRYSEYNRQWGVEEFLITSFNLRNPLYDHTGAFFTNNKFYGIDTMIYNEVESTTINNDFIQLLHFCSLNDINLNLFTAPIYNVGFDIESQKNMIKAIDSLGIRYRSYLTLFNDSTYFNDNTHLSKHGGAVFTDFLIIWCKEILRESKIKSTH